MRSERSRCYRLAMINPVFNIEKLCNRKGAWGKRHNTPDEENRVRLAGTLVPLIAGIMPRSTYTSMCSDEIQEAEICWRNGGEIWRRVFDCERLIILACAA